MVYYLSMCWKCGKIIDNIKVYHSTTCPDCSADLHVCKNCSFYEVGSHYDCHETIDEQVFDKAKANFCDSFSLKTNFTTTLNSKKEDAKNAFNNLFK